MSEHELVTRDEVAADIPLQARSLERLSRRERARYYRSRSLLALGGGVRSLISRDVALTGLGVFEALLEQSWAVRFASPAETVCLAEAALDIARQLDPRGYGAKRVADLRARAWGELGNAYRAADQLLSAQQAFGRAYTLLRKGTDDPYLRARLFDLEASLLGTLREFPLALRRLTSLSSLYRELGDPHLSGRALIIQALYTFYSGETEEAISINEQGIQLLDRQRDPALLMFATHNYLLFLVDLGRFTLAKRILFENRRSLIYKDRINALRFRGIEGQISYGEGALMSAEIAFREVKEGLIDAGMSFYLALVNLELAMVLIRQGRIEEAKEEVIVAREFFLSLEVYREYAGSMIYLEECFRRNEATADLLELTIRYLWRKELHRPPRPLR